MVQSMALLQNQGDGMFENMTEYAGVAYQLEKTWVGVRRSLISIMMVGLI